MSYSIIARRRTWQRASSAPEPRIHIVSDNGRGHRRCVLFNLPYRQLNLAFRRWYDAWRLPANESRRVYVMIAGKEFFPPTQSTYACTLSRKLSGVVVHTLGVPDALSLSKVIEDSRDVIRLYRKEWEVWHRRYGYGCWVMSPQQVNTLQGMQQCQPR